MKNPQFRKSLATYIALAYRDKIKAISLSMPVKHALLAFVDTFIEVIDKEEPEFDSNEAADAIPLALDAIRTKKPQQGNAWKKQFANKIASAYRKKFAMSHLGLMTSDPTAPKYAAKSSVEFTKEQAKRYRRGDFT